MSVEQCPWCNKNTGTYTTTLGAKVCTSCGEWKNSSVRRTTLGSIEDRLAIVESRLDVHRKIIDSCVSRLDQHQTSGDVALRRLDKIEQRHREESEQSASERASTTRGLYRYIYELSDSELVEELDRRGRVIPTSVGGVPPYRTSRYLIEIPQ